VATHEELIKSKFIVKFRNPLRNYYTYGFMSYNDYIDNGNTKSSIYDVWNRLKNVLAGDGYFKWSKKEAMFISADSQSQLCNPFHRVYRFCMYN
jgi:hypothetical protein